MKITRTFALVGALLIGSGGLYFAGCSADQVEHVARDVQYVAGGPATQPTTEPTTQPSAEQIGLNVGRTTVDVISKTSPMAKTIFGIIAMGAGAVASIASHRKGNQAGQKQSTGIIAEIAGDIASFKNPDEPWSATAAKALIDLGLNHLT